MERSATRVVARTLYGALFLAVVPLALLAWARATTDSVPLPAVQSAVGGTLLFALGVVCMVAGWYALIVYGHGLPMNAFPPQLFVRRGVFRYIGHPIYVGFAFICFGAALFYGSASGFWLVAPVTALAMAALVLGYENHDLRTRFGNAASARPLLSLPEAALSAPSAWDRVSVYVLVLLPWLVLYEAVHQLGIPRDAIISHLPFEKSLPVLGWTEAIYATPYLAVPAIPLIARTRSQLREFALLGLIATSAVTLIYILVPLIAPPRPFTPVSWLGELLATERALSNTVAAFPAFHVIWAAIAAHVAVRIKRRWFAPAWIWVFAVAASCITTGMHSVADIVFAFIAYAALTRRSKAWAALRAAAEYVANSWREWRIGPVRIINHGLYAGIGVAFGLYLAGIVTGAPLHALVTITTAALVGAGLWAQFIEGSPRLLRPYGYYGGIIGGIVAAVFVGRTINGTLLLLAGFSVCAPWVQAWGRVRCLVQGCCHGSPASPAVGIRYFHSRSRVTQIPDLTGVPLHPTPLYSILSNIVIGLLLARLWLLGAAPSLIFGLYLILNALARFVEESYRGEPQTPMTHGLRIYQWLAISFVIAGVLATLLPADPFPPATLWNAGYTLAALAMLLVTTAALGVDFPASNARFSRLAEADGEARLLPERVVEPAVSVAASR